MNILQSGIKIEQILKHKKTNRSTCRNMIFENVTVYKKLRPVKYSVLSDQGYNKPSATQLWNKLGS